MFRRTAYFLLIIIGIIALNSCSDKPKRTVYYTVTNITTDVDGYKFSLRNQETGHPAHLHYPEIRFSKGDELIMKRDKDEVTFILKPED